VLIFLVFPVFQRRFFGIEFLVPVPVVGYARYGVQGPEILDITYLQDDDSIIKDISRPDLALFCLEEGFMINKIVSNKNDGPMIILKVLINTAISLAINDNKLIKIKNNIKY